MPISFEERVEQAWVESDWIIQDMFDGGMCFFEGYVAAIDLDSLDVVLSQLTETSIDCRYSTWSNDTDESDWNRSYPLTDYINFFRAGRIITLHADYRVTFSGYVFALKLMFVPDENLEIIFYRENLLPRTETQTRFKAACHYLRHLYTTFHGAALYLGPDTLNYPDSAETSAEEWQRLI